MERHLAYSVLLNTRANLAHRKIRRIEVIAPFSLSCMRIRTRTRSTVFLPKPAEYTAHQTFADIFRSYASLALRSRSELSCNPPPRFHCSQISLCCMMIRHCCSISEAVEVRCLADRLYTDAAAMQFWQEVWNERTRRAFCFFDLHYLPQIGHAIT